MTLQAAAASTSRNFENGGVTVSLYEELAKLTLTGRPFVLATVIASQGSTPQKPGSKMVVLATGKVLETIGGGAIEHQVVTASLALLADSASHTQIIETHLTHDLGMCCGGTMTVFLEKHEPAAKLWVFGAGHVAKELAHLADLVGFQVTVIDEREDLLSDQRFPTAQRIVAYPPDIAKSLPGGADCYFCVTTHDHPLDQACIEALLSTPSAYLGVIGSRRKASRFRQRLLAAGFSDMQTARFESPMGIDIAAQTPQEIAVSIVGRLISIRRAPSASR
jgi:xanthine dehydrogenase accessory factor